MILFLAISSTVICNAQEIAIRSHSDEIQINTTLDPIENSGSLISLYYSDKSGYWLFCAVNLNSVFRSIPEKSGLAIETCIGNKIILHCEENLFILPEQFSLSNTLAIAKYPVEEKYLAQICGEGIKSFRFQTDENDVNIKINKTEKFRIYLSTMFSLVYSDVHACEIFKYYE